MRAIFAAASLAAAMFGGLTQSAVAAPSDIPVPSEAARSADIESARTPFSKSWPAKTGGRITRVSAAPLYWKDSEGRIREFDLGLERGASGDLTAVSGQSAIALPSGSTATEPVVVRDGDDRISLTLRGSQAATPQVKGERAVYPNVIGGVDRTLSVTTRGVKEDLVLAGPDSPRSFSYTLALSDGLVPSIAKNGSVVVKRGSRVAFSIPRGVLYEQRNQKAVASAAPYKLERTGSTWDLQVTAEGAWTRKEGRSWPVVLDPSIERNELDATTETECVTGGPTQLLTCSASPQDPDPSSGPDQDQPPEVPAFEWANVGWDWNGFRRAYTLEGFDLSVLPTSYTVTEAKLNVWLEDSAYSDSYPGTPDVRTRQDLEVASLAVPSTATSGPGGTRAPLRPLPVSKQKAVTGTMVKMEVTSEIRQWMANLWDFDHTDGRAQIGFGVRAIGEPNNTVHSQIIGCQVETQTDSCDQLMTRVATSLNSDSSKHPYLDVKTMAPAEIGSDIRSPAEGQLTSRFVELQASASNTGVTTAKFEYTTGTSRDWTVIPASALRYWDSGTQPTTNDIPTPSNGSSTKLSRSVVWDLNKTPGAETDGPIHVRALLDAGLGAGGGVTAERNFRLDRKNPETSTTEDVGPAAVDLLTGDVNITETDAEVKAFLDDLSLTRTYHSRGGSPRATDMFGPGWTSSFEVDGGEMPYKSIYDFTQVDESQELVDFNVVENDAFYDSFDEEYGTFDFSTLNVDPVYETVRYETRYAVLEQADGSKITFKKSGSSWVPDDEHSDLVIDDPTVGGQRTFTVKDPDGSITKFEADSPGAPNYRPSEYAEAGSSAKTTLQHEVVSGRKRLRRVLAPAPAGVTCPTSTSSSWVAGCRALDLRWGTVTVAGRTEQRVIAVKLRAIDPSGTVAGDSHTIAEYEYDPNGRLKKVSDPRTSTGLPIQYAYDSEGRLQTYTPAGERPWTFAYQSTPGDDGNGRVRSITRKTPAGADATTTFVYDVPLSGTGAPHNMSPTAVGAWAQRDLPRTATAVFPPDTVPAGGGQPSSWHRATIHYLAAHGKTVNTADPEGNISTTAYNSKGKVTRELTPRNRQRALAASGSTSDRSEELDTQQTYLANGVDLINVTGPEHQIRRPNGSTVVGRQRTTYSYDELKPSDAAFDGDQHLVTRIQKATRISSTGTTVDVETTTNAYSDGTNHRGWQVKQPLSTTLGSGSEAATTKFTYDGTYPLLTQKRLPKASGADSHATLYSYYGIGTPPSWCTTAGGLSSTAVDAARGLVCAATPGAQPASGPDRVGTYTRYSLLWDPTEEREATSNANVAGSALRTTVIGRDALGRESTRSVTAAGRAIPNTTTSYDATTGRKTTTTSAAITGTAANTITRTWDDNGRLRTYTDADGGTTTHGYDVNGRLTTSTDSRGTRGLIYDDRDLVETVTDTTLPSTITTVRDADGELVQQTLPGGLKATTTINENGDPIGLTWERTTGCSSSCTWVQSNAQRDGQGRIATHTTLNAEQRYAYDTVGRIKRSEEQRGTTCTVREYSYDANSNRTALATNTASAGTACGSGSTSTKSSSYDGADRLKNTGYAYDALGRTSNVPAADAAGGTATTLTHDADDLLASSTAGTRGQTLQRDPERRLRNESSNPLGGSAALSTVRYADDDDAPTAKTTANGWERYIGDVDDVTVATVTSTGTVTWELSDLKGDTVATAASGATSPATKSEFGEFGTSTWNAGTVAAKGIRHAWLGGHGTHTAFDAGGLVHMGARAYLPSTGRFLEPDPVEGGSANAYDYVDQDPLNTLDLSGRCPWCVAVAVAAARKFAPRAVRGAVRWAKGRRGRAPKQTPGGEHTKNARPSTKGTHQKGQKRKQQPYTDKKRQKPNWRPRHG